MRPNDNDQWHRCFRWLVPPKDTVQRGCRQSSLTSPGSRNDDAVSDCQISRRETEQLGAYRASMTSAPVRRSVVTAAG